MRELQRWLRKNRSILPVTGALLLASCACAGLLLCRIYGTSGSLLYRWIIVPNLMLAWIPLVCAVLARAWWQTGKRPRLRAAAALGVWLLFFPNAPYVITDLVHLTYLKTAVPIHFDILLNAFTALTALLTGLFSLYLIHEELEIRIGSRAGWCLVACLLFLCSIGVFLGRFLRWNSWDAFRQPVAIMADAAALFTEAKSFVFTGTFMVFLSFSYFIVYACLRYRPYERQQAEKGADSSCPNSPI